VNVTVSLETLLGLNEDPGDLTGHGPITAPLARDLAFSKGSTWRRLVTDPITGYLLDYGRTKYRPPDALADHVRARDMTCRSPNCERPATACDLDHVVAWPAGTTCEANLCTQCRHDHLLKHQGRWHHQISDDPDHPPGTVIMTSPTGHAYLSYPYAYTDAKPASDSASPAASPAGSELSPKTLYDKGAPNCWTTAEPEPRPSPEPGPPPPF
jgi:hypothetical protein